MADVRGDLLKALLERHQASLSELANHVGREPSLTLHHLQALVHEGVVERDETGNRPVYRPRHYFSAFWVNPDDALAERWAVARRISWRFPLASRIADDRAAGAAIEFLKTAEAAGLFGDPTALTRERRRGETWYLPLPPKEDWTAARRVRVAVFGSAARGEMGRSSDLDLLVLAGKGIHLDRLRRRVEDVVAEVNLTAPRRLDVKVVAGLADLPSRYVAEIRRDAKVIHATDDEAFTAPLWEVPARG